MNGQQRDYLFLAGEFLYSLLLRETRQRPLLSSAIWQGLPPSAADDLALYRKVMYGMLAFIAVLLLTMSMAVLIIGTLAAFFARRVAERLYANLSPYIPAEGTKTVLDYLRNQK